MRVPRLVVFVCLFACFLAVWGNGATLQTRHLFLRGFKYCVSAVQWHRAVVGGKQGMLLSKGKEQQQFLVPMCRGTSIFSIFRDLWHQATLPNLSTSFFERSIMLSSLSLSGPTQGGHSQSRAAIPTERQVLRAGTPHGADSLQQEPAQCHL